MSKQMGEAANVVVVEVGCGTKAEEYMNKMHDTMPSVAKMSKGVYGISDLRTTVFVAKKLGRDCQITALIRHNYTFGTSTKVAAKTASRIRSRLAECGIRV